MHAVGIMSGNTRYCPERGVSLAYTACYECSRFQKWSDEPSEMPICFWDWLEWQELKYLDTDLDTLRE